MANEVKAVTLDQFLNEGAPRKQGCPICGSQDHHDTGWARRRRCDNCGQVFVQWRDGRRPGMAGVGA